MRYDSSECTRRGFLVASSLSAAVAYTPLIAAAGTIAPLPPLLTSAERIVALNEIKKAASGAYVADDNAQNRLAQIHATLPLLNHYISSVAAHSSDQVIGQQSPEEISNEEIEALKQVTIYTLNYAHFQTELRDEDQDQGAAFIRRVLVLHEIALKRLNQFTDSGINRQQSMQFLSDLCYCNNFVDAGIHQKAAEIIERVFFSGHAQCLNIDQVLNTTLTSTSISSSGIAPVLLCRIPEKIAEAIQRETQKTRDLAKTPPMDIEKLGKMPLAEVIGQIAKRACDVHASTTHNQQTCLKKWLVQSFVPLVTEQVKLRSELLNCGLLYISPGTRGFFDTPSPQVWVRGVPLPILNTNPNTPIEPFELTIKAIACVADLKRSLDLICSAPISPGHRHDLMNRFNADISEILVTRISNYPVHPSGLNATDSSSALNQLVSSQLRLVTAISRAKELDVFTEPQRDIIDDLLFKTHFAAFLDRFDPLVVTLQNHQYRDTSADACISRAFEFNNVVSQLVGAVADNPFAPELKERFFSQLQHLLVDTYFKEFPKNLADTAYTVSRSDKLKQRVFMANSFRFLETLSRLTDKTHWDTFIDLIAQEAAARTDDRTHALMLHQLTFIPHRVDCGEKLQQIFWSHLQTASEDLIQQGLQPLILSLFLRPHYAGLDQEQARCACYAATDALSHLIQRKEIQAGLHEKSLDPFGQLITLALTGTLPDSLETVRLNHMERQQLRAASIILVTELIQSSHLTLQPDEDHEDCEIQGIPGISILLERFEGLIPLVERLSGQSSLILTRLTELGGTPLFGDSLNRALGAILELQDSLANEAVANLDYADLLGKGLVQSDRFFGQKRGHASRTADLYFNLLDLSCTVQFGCFPEQVGRREQPDLQKLESQIREYVAITERKMAVGLALMAYDNITDEIRTESRDSEVSSRSDRRPANQAIRVLKCFHFFDRYDTQSENLTFPSTADYRNLLVKIANAIEHEESEALRDVCDLISRTEQIVPAISRETTPRTPLTYNPTPTFNSTQDCLRSTDNAPLYGKLASIQQGNVMFVNTDGTQSVVPLKQLIELKFPQTQAAINRADYPQEIFLTDGSSIIGRNFTHTKGDKDLAFVGPGNLDIRCLENQVDGFIVRPLTEAQHRKFRELQKSTRTGALLLFPEGDQHLNTLPVRILGISDTTMTVSVEIDRRWHDKPVSFEKIAGVLWSPPNQIPVAHTQEEKFRVKGHWGTVVASEIQFNRGKFLLKNSSQQTETIVPLAEVLEIDSSGPLTQLQQLAPVRSAFNPIDAQTMRELIGADVSKTLDPELLYTMLSSLSQRSRRDLINPDSRVLSLTAGSKVEYLIPPSPPGSPPCRSLNLQITGEGTVQITARTNDTPIEMLVEGVVDRSTGEMHLSAPRGGATHFIITVLPRPDTSAGVGGTVEITGSFR